MKTLVIMSGAYVEPALVAEFGPISPAFLPVKGRPLFEQQIELAEHIGANRIVLVLPDSFRLVDHERERFAERNVTIIFSPVNEGLGSSIGRALAACSTPSVSILFGDTMVAIDSTRMEDYLTVGRAEQLGRWTICEAGVDGSLTFTHDLYDQGQVVVAGYFSFSDRNLLLECLARNSSDYFNAVAEYSRSKPVHLHETERWFDFGHVSSYYRSRSRSFNTRSFNSAVAVGNIVTKTGEPKRKIFAEAQWFRHLPDPIKVHTPHLISVDPSESCSYSLEYIHLPLISDVFCFGRLRHASWRVILNSCVSFLAECSSYRPQLHELPIDYPELFYSSMIRSKTMSRIEKFAADGRVDIHRPFVFNGRVMPPITEIVDKLEALIIPTKIEDICLWHGDFHFGNIFFDFRSSRIKVIDPRGMLPDGNTAMFGDMRYDMAKLAHSVIGLYDYLQIDAYHVALNSPTDLAFDFPIVERMAPLIDEFKAMRLGEYSFGDPPIMALCALLFLSMLPLHADAPRRQLAMLGNGLRLVEDLGMVA